LPTGVRGANIDPAIKPEDEMKELRCREVGFDCQAVVRAETDEAVMRQAAEHARSQHGLKQLDDATTQKIRSKIRTVSS
jgi:predicted small metal-binding protein